MVNTVTGFEIEMFPVGSGGSKNGDAIVIRYKENNELKIMVIDGGTKESGRTIVEHIKKRYQTTVVDYVVNTHPDGDHASGLNIVLEELTVKELWMHLPWKYCSKIKDFYDGRTTINSLSNRFKEKLTHAATLEKTAYRYNIPIKEPFQGSQIGVFTVISPSKNFYVKLVPDFDKSPKQLMKKISEAVEIIYESTINTREDWNTETLHEDNTDITAENESSVVLYGLLNKRGILLTGDAGVKGLTEANDYAIKNGIHLKDCKFIKIPHHGGRHNLTPTLLNEVIGNILPEDSKPTKTAYINVAYNNKEYPKRVIVNALIRRGVKVFSTADGSKRHYSGDIPVRTFKSAEALDLYPKAEDD